MLSILSKIILNSSTYSLFMGIFDTIEVAHTCTCGKLYADYKTHALGNVLETYRLGERLNIPDLEIVIGSCQNA